MEAVAGLHDIKVVVRIIIHAETALGSILDLHLPGVFCRDVSEVVLDLTLVGEILPEFESVWGHVDDGYEMSELVEAVSDVISGVSVFSLAVWLVWVINLIFFIVRFFYIWVFVLSLIWGIEDRDLRLSRVLF